MKIGECYDWNAFNFDQNNDNKDRPFILWTPIYTFIDDHISFRVRGRLGMAHYFNGILFKQKDLYTVA